MRIHTLKAIFESTVVGFLIFSASSVTVFARSAMTWEDLSVPIILLAFSAIITFSYNVIPSPKFILFLCGFFILSAIQGMISGSFHPKYLILYPLNFCLAYCCISAMRERFLTHVERLITYLTGISLAIWSMDIAFDGVVRQLLNGVVLGTPYNKIVHTYIIIQTFTGEGVEAFFPRNSGFTWEPGAFSVLCSLGLTINLLRCGFTISGNYRAIILISGILSSQSTTGYSIILIFTILKIWHDMSSAGRIFVFPAFAAFILFSTMTLPFMQNKIENLWNQDLRELTISASREWNTDEPVAAQRFLSFKLDFLDFLNNPLTGYGGDEDQMFARREAYNIVSISGIGKVLARFGIFGFVFFAWSTIRSSVMLSRRYRSKSPLLLTSYIVAVSISYSLIEHPLFIAIWCCAFFWPDGQKDSIRQSEEMQS